MPSGRCRTQGDREPVRPWWVNVRINEIATVPPGPDEPAGSDRNPYAQLTRHPLRSQGRRPGEGRAELEHGVRRVSSEWRQCGSSDRTRARGTESLGADLKERVRQAGAVLVEVVVDVGSVLARRVRVRGRSFPPEFRFDPGRALTVLQDVYNAIPLSPLCTRLLRAASASGTPPSRPQHRSPQRRARALPQAGPGVDVRRAGGVHPHRRRTSAPGDCGWGVRPQVPGPTAQTAPGVPVPDLGGLHGGRRGPALVLPCPGMALPRAAVPFWGAERL